MITNPTPSQEQACRKNEKRNVTPKWVIWTFLIIAIAGSLLRLSGILRGRDDSIPFHPDAPKQVHALENYMHGQYVFYIHKRAYDGYPLFLEHLDEWIIRPSYAIYRRAHDWINPDSAPLSPYPSYNWFRQLLVPVVLLLFAVLEVVARLGG